MQATFTAQILADKLAKLNSTQQSIETLSHWCIFHRRNAKQVVDIWEREFFQAPRERRVPFLYLANDILQNSRRKGAEFVTEFWRVLAGALKDVVKNGDDHNRNTVFRLVDIWEERRVFGSHAQGLRNELLGKEPSANTTEGPLPEKLVSVYETFHDKLVDEESVIDKCNNAVSNLEAIEKEINLSSISGQETIMIEELQHQENVLLECGIMLEAAELARSSIVFQLKETLRDQEEKLERTRLLLQAAHSQAEQARMMQQQIYDRGEAFQQQPVNGSDEKLLAQFNNLSSPMLFSSSSCEAESYVPTEAKLFDPASVAAKLVASTSSAAMISSMLSSLAAETLPKLTQQQGAQESNPAETKISAGDEDRAAAAGGGDEEPEAKRLKAGGGDDQSPLSKTEVEEEVVAVADGEMLASGSGGDQAAAAAATVAATSSATATYLDTSMLFNFAAGQFALPVTSTSSAPHAPPPGCAPADYQQTSSAPLGFFAAPSEKFV